MHTERDATHTPLYFNAQISQFDGINKHPLQVTPTVTQTIEYIQSNTRLQQDIETCRTYLQHELAEDARDEHGTLLLKDYTKAKKHLPGVTWTGSFTERANTRLLQCSGFLSFDIDFIDKSNPSSQKYDDLRDHARDAYKLLKQDKYTAFLFPSVSAAGLKGIVKIPAVKNDSEYKTYFRAYMEYIQQACSQTLDSLPDIARLCFLSYCESPYINHEAEIFTQQTTSQEPPPPQTEPSNGSHDPSIQAAIYVLSQHGIQQDIPRNEFVGLCAAFKRANVEYSTFDMIMQKSPGYDAQNNFKIWNTVSTETALEKPKTSASLIGLARQANKQLFRDVRKRVIATDDDGNFGQESLGLAYALEQKLSTRYLFRLNAITDKISVTENKKTRLMSDFEESLIRCWLLDNGYGKRDAISDVVKAMAYKNLYNPIQDYLKGLHWEGVSQFDKVDQYFIDSDRIFAEVFKAWCVGAVRRIFTGQHHQVLIFSGEQGEGKSFFARWLCPLKDFHIVHTINPDTNDAKIRVSENWIWEVGEVGSTTRKADIEQLNQFVALETAVFRRSHDKYDQRKLAIASFIGTVNPNGAGFLNDPSGYRRWWPIALAEIHKTYTEYLNVHQLWAEAMYLYKEHGDNACEVSSTTQEIIDRNIETEFEIEDPVENLCLQCLEFTGEQHDFLSTTEILVEISRAGYRQTNPRADSMAIGKALKRLMAQGYSLTRGRRYSTRGDRGFFGIRPAEMPIQPIQPDPTSKSGRLDHRNH